MTAAVDDMSDQLDQKAPEGPGSRLKAARQASGMDLERVAAELHLKPAQVEALEQDNYDAFDARVFIRGYLRNYARLVGLPVDGVLDSFDAAFPDPDQARKLRRVGNHKPQVGSGHGVVRTVSWVLLLGIVALFLVWWAGYLELNGEHGLTTGDAVVEDASDGAAPERGNGLLPLLPQPAELAEPAAPADGAPPADTAPLAEPAPAAPQPAAAESATPGDGVDGADAAEPAPVADTAPPAPLGPQMVLTLTGPCWVQIRDSSGEYKLIGNLGAGTREVLGGEPPYKVLLGNAAVAQLTVDGQPVDLAPHTRAQVARLTLTADTR